MNEDINFFLRESAGHARSLPVREAVAFLRGLLLVCDPSMTDQIRHQFDALSNSDRQLELIQTGQIKLNFSRASGSGDGWQGKGGSK